MLEGEAPCLPFYMPLRNTSRQEGFCFGQRYPYYFRLAIHFLTLPNELHAARLILCYLFSRVPSLCCICRSAKRLSDTLIIEDVFYNYLVNTLAQISLHLVHLLSVLPNVSLCQAYCRPTSHRSVKSHTSSILLELICYSKTFKMSDQLRSRYSRPRPRPESNSASYHESDSSSHTSSGSSSSSESNSDSNAETEISRRVATPIKRPMSRCSHTVTTGKAPSPNLVRGASKRTTCSEKIPIGSREGVSKCSSNSLPQGAELKSY